MKKKIVIGLCSGALAVSLIVTGVSSTVYAAKNNKITQTESKEKTSDTTVDTDSLVSDLFSSNQVEEKEIGKEETVYLITDANGKVNTTIVSDHLLNDDAKDTIEDKSNLTDIVNVKGDETYTANGDNLTWDAQGNEIYYQGNTNAEAPVKQTITYFLDGKETSFENLKGASGSVTIRFDYENTTSYSEKVDGKNYEVAVPFVAMSALVLDDNFTNIQVTNGKVSKTSSGNVVVGYAFPGLTDSLNIKDGDLEDFEIPEYFEVTADVENFDISIAMTLVANAGSYIGSNGISLDSLDDVIDSLSDASLQLQDGSAELADGMDTLYSGLEAYLDGASKLNEGIQKLADASSSLVSGANQINDGASQVSNGASSLSTGASQLNTASADYFTGVNALVSTVQNMPETIKTQVNSSLDKLNTAGFAQIVYALGYDKDTNNKITIDNLNNVTDFVAGNEASIETAMLCSNQTLMTALVTNGASFGVNSVDTAKAFCAAAMADHKSTQYTALDTYFQGAATTAVTTYNQALVGLYQAQGAASVYSAVAATVNGTETQTQLAALNAGTSQMQSGIASLDSGASQLASGASTLASGTKSLVDALPALTDGVSQLSNGSKTLVGNNETLLSGAAQLKEGSHTLSDGMVTFNEEGINKIVDAYQGDVSDLVNRLNVVIAAADSYGAFTEAADGVNASTSFIYKISF